MTLTHVMMDSRKTKVSAYCLVQDLVFGIMIWIPYVSVSILYIEDLTLVLMFY